MEIELIRGDTSDTYKFQRTNDDGVITTKVQNVWITFKRTPECKECLFQKTLRTGGVTFSEEDYFYRFKIEKDDTCDLLCGTYGFDIAILNEIGEKKTLINNGVLKIVNNYTHKENEV